MDHCNDLLVDPVFLAHDFQLVGEGLCGVLLGAILYPGLYLTFSVLSRWQRHYWHRVKNHRSVLHHQVVITGYIMTSDGHVTSIIFIVVKNKIKLFWA